MPPGQNDKKWEDILAVELPELSEALQLGEYAPLKEGTFAERMAHFQKQIAAQTGGKTLPIFLSPKLARSPTSAREVRDPNIIIKRMTVIKVPVKECLHYICSLANLHYKITPDGVLIWTDEENGPHEGAKK